MRRGPKPAKSKEAKPPVGRKSPKSDGARVRDLEKRLEEALRDKAEGQEQQTATAGILRVISSSPTDVQPVFETIVKNAARLCDAVDSTIFQVDGASLILVAHHGPIPSLPVGALRPLVPGAPSGRAVLEKRIIHNVDLQAEADEYPEGSALARTLDFRSVLSVPLIRGGAAIGVIAIRRIEARPFTERQTELLRTFADQAVIAIENVRLFKELEQRNSDLIESLARQMATSEVLRVISQSPTDLQPVFDTIAENARRLLRGYGGLVVRFDGQLLHVAGMRSGSGRSEDEIRARFPMPPSQDNFSGAVIFDRDVKQIADIETDDRWVSLRDHARRQGWRANLGVPMMHNGQPIGVISVTRREPGGYSPQEVELLKTFADQAVIAIENVRLFKELQEKNSALTTAHAQVSEALEQQTATAEILRVISSSPTDVQPVFDTIAESAVRLCNGFLAGVYRFDGSLIHFVAHHNWTEGGLEIVRSMYPRPPSRETQVSTAILDRRVVEVRDFESDPEVPAPSRPLARALGYRSILVVPMLREGNPIGAIAVPRAEAGPFSVKQVELVKTFADQAVIAIENVRLFTELQEKNQALTDAHAQVTEALEQQTATSDILRVISSSPTDVQPVFDAIARCANQLCDSQFSAVFRFDGTLLHFAAHSGWSPSGVDALRRAFPIVPHRGSAGGRAILTGAVAHIPDVHADADYTLGAVGDVLRSTVAVPMVREGVAIGTINVARFEPGPFSDRQIELLKTFADQAVIAIENVRLFKELEARTGELSRSVEKLTALGEVSQAVSSTLDLETVLATIVSRAVQLSGSHSGIIYEFEEAAQNFQARATHRISPEHLEALRATPIRLGEGAVGRAGAVREPVEVSDIEDSLVAPQSRGLLAREGMGSLVAVPLVREDRLLGGLVIVRRERGAFSPEVVAMLQTFAAQSVLAIQNARLFREIADKSRQLEVASQHKSEFLANMSHELRTPLNAIIGFSEVLAEKMFGELNEKQEEYSKDIHASGQHLLSLINDILDLSKIEAGRMELELTDFHLPTALDSALTLVRERAARRGITLQMNVDERLGDVRADERKVRQVVLNLLSNAIKFTPEGGRIEVGAVTKDGVVEVSVSDTGVGIAPEDQEAVFEEFRQVGTAEKKVEGTGLGLTLCRKFVELHGGTIWVKSQVGAGSTFTFTIPVRRGE